MLTRAVEHPELFGADSTLEDIVAQWHASIGKAILENWGFQETLAQAVGDQDDLSRPGEGAADLTDVLSVAILMTDHGKHPAALESALEDVDAAQRLGLTKSKVGRVMAESAAEVSALSEALGV